VKLIELFIVIVIVLLGVFIMSIFLSKYPELFYRDSPVGLCEANLPDKPNWVSSLVDRKDSHYISPLSFNEFDDIRQCIYNVDPKSYIIVHPKYIEGYRRTNFFGFTDWFCIKDSGQVTSSATVGYSDLGKNRQWVDKLRSQLLQYGCIAY
jgi:uncharacterized protein (DUF1499 family)